MNKMNKFIQYKNVKYYMRYLVVMKGIIAQFV